MCDMQQVKHFEGYSEYRDAPACLAVGVGHFPVTSFTASSLGCCCKGGGVSVFCSVDRQLRPLSHRILFQ